MGELEVTNDWGFFQVKKIPKSTVVMATQVEYTKPLNGKF